MTSARLSPAANLLRNSKLFALPAAVPLPAARPSSEVVSNNDTATTPYPTKAAIYTTGSSLARGDWGLKRSLPGKAFAQTKTPVIRLRGDVDTQEHIADFDSAGDHVLTLQKWEDVPVLMTTSKTSFRQKEFSVFKSTLDNTTNKPSAVKVSALHPQKSSPHVPWSEKSRDHFFHKAPIGPNDGIAFPQDILEGKGLEGFESESAATSQATSAEEPIATLEETLEQYKKDYAAQGEAAVEDFAPPRPQVEEVPVVVKKWRFDGPWLAGMTNFGFEEFLRRINNAKSADFREHLRQSIVSQREKEHASALDQARQEGVESPSVPSLEVSDEEVSNHLRDLRRKPQEFSTAIAEFLDLPDGPRDPSVFDLKEAWYYSRGLGMAEAHKSFGPPSTHPSAGFSYLRSTRFAANDAVRGPMDPSKILPARLLKESLGYGPQRGKAIGVGGFVVEPEQLATAFTDYSAARGGPKMTAKVNDASVLNDGSLKLGVSVASFKVDSQNVPVVDPQFNRGKLPEGSKNIPQLDQLRARRANGRPTPIRYRMAQNPAETSKESDEDYDKVMQQVFSNPALRGQSPNV